MHLQLSVFPDELTTAYKEDKMMQKYNIYSLVNASKSLGELYDKEN